MSDVVVIGAGLIGSAVAYYAALAGAHVTVLEAVRPGGGTSSTTFSWLNANNKTPHEYFDLNVLGMREHAALKADLGVAPWLHEGGNLEWAGDAAGRAALLDKVERLRDWGYTAKLLSPAQVRSRLEPGLNIGGDAADPAAYFPEECWLDPLPLIHALLRMAEQHGARVRIARVTRVDLMAGRVLGVVTEDGARIAADVVVDCAGKAANEVASLAGFSLPMANTAGLLAVTAPAPTGLSRIVHAPRVNIRPDGAGRLLLHSDETDLTIDAGTAPSVELPGCQELLRRARAVLPALAGVPLEAARVGIRPIPADGHSAVGWVPGVEGAYLAVTHSGATLCLALGRMVASELTGRGDAPELKQFRPSRFLSTVGQR